MSYLVQRVTSRAILLAMVFCSLGFSQSLAVIRDTELENALRVYMQPLLKAANLQNERLTVTIVPDPHINAAVLPGGNIIIHSGLLMKAEDPTEVAGVLAHELGHYVNNDLLKLSEQISHSQSSSLLGTALGLGLAIATQSAEPLVAGQLLGVQVGERNILKFSRSMESAADRRAVDLLHRSGLGLQGMVKLNERLLEIYPDPKNSEAEYLSTHPLTGDRVDYFTAQSERLGSKPIPVGWQEVHERIRAKLAGFLEAPQILLDKYAADSQTLPAQMARAIALMRLARYDEALSLMDKVLETHPEDGFLHDLMGDIARSSGQTDRAIKHYSKAIELLPWASLIRYQRAGLWLRQKMPEAALAARDDLREALRFEPSVPLYWQTLAEAHLQLDETAHADLAKAEAAMLTNRFRVAKSFARRAQLEFSVGSADWLRADDILKQIENAPKS